MVAVFNNYECCAMLSIVVWVFVINLDTYRINTYNHYLYSVHRECQIGKSGNVHHWSQITNTGRVHAVTKCQSYLSIVQCERVFRCSLLVFFSVWFYVDLTFCYLMTWRFGLIFVKLTCSRRQVIQSLHRT